MAPGLKYYRAREVAAAGGNDIELLLPEGGRLKVLRVRNVTKGWQWQAASLLQIGSKDSETGIALIYGVQDGAQYEMSWFGDLLLGDYRLILAAFANCDASDDILVTAGVE